MGKEVIDEGWVGECLSERLGGYMVGRDVIEIEEFGLNVWGKLDIEGVGNGEDEVGENEGGLRIEGDNEREEKLVGI
ncbi:hypothetical protein, partial [Bacillus pumilus]|uniref:hypothetical protein n=1 Tax=Bacillus pumilus TaxID=1408 RepID=UPI0011AAECDB